MAGSQNLTMKAKGLFTHANPLSGSNPEGSFALADNVVIDRNDVTEPRRGFAQYGDSFGVGTDRTKQLFNYKDVILRHVLTNIQFDSDNAGNFVNFSGPSILEVDTGLRIKGIEANGNFYFVSSTGIKKISARNAADFVNITIQEAGGVKALDVTAMPNYTTTGFLEPNSKAAYRVVWGIKDNNENLILGSPSARSVVYNITESSCIVDLSFAIPADVQSTNYFYQIYRTGVFSATLPAEPADPGEEMYLVFEENVSSAQLIAGVVNVTDITPEDFRRNGTLLYSNPQSGDGIEQANEKPPFAKDIALYKGYTFLANTKTVQRLNLSFLSVTGMTTNVSTFSISDGTSTNTYTFQGSVETYTTDFTGTIHSDYVNAAPGTAKYFTLTSANDERTYVIWWNESANDEEPSISGAINIEVPIVGGDTVSQIVTKTATAINTATDDFNISIIGGTELESICSNNGYVTVVPTETVTGSFTNTKDGLGTGEDAAAKKIFLPRVPTGTENGPTTSQQLEQVARSLVKVITEEDDIVYAYYISGFNDVPGQILFEQQITTGPAFYLNSNVGNQFVPFLPVSGNTIISTNEVKPNRIYFSKYQQPEAFPLANYIDIGPQDREIKRIIPLRDSLLIFKEDGIYRLSGDVAPFTVAPFDFSSQVLAADTLVVLNNQIYGLSTQGVIVVTDTGVSVISRPIENQLLKVLREGFDYKLPSFGVTYETDRSYLLWTVSSSTDTVATQCFRYNTFTNSWTRWNNSKTCGIVNFADDKLYLGAGDLNIIEKERKSLTRTDYADREYDLEVQLDGIVDNTIALNSVSEVEVGDVVLQMQYLTSSQFNRILEKLDRDIGVNDTTYLATLGYVPGQNMRANLEGLATKLDNDLGVADNNYAATIADLTYSITNISAASQSVLTIGSHGILPGRYVNVSGTNSVPSINGLQEVVAVGATTITINKSVSIAGNAGSAQTAINSFQDMQGCFNLIVDKLNNDNQVFYSNYPESTGVTELEAVVLDIDTVDALVTTLTPQAWLFGEITLYKAINTTVIWNPQYFGDPSVEKQVREGTMMFENGNFSRVVIAYSSDRSPSFVETEFDGAGIGDWGQFNWGTSVNWGGVAAPKPLRTYVPLDKQRCRFINVKFNHKVAFEKFSIYGISLTFRPYNIRTTK